MPPHLEDNTCYYCFVDEEPRKNKVFSLTRNKPGGPVSLKPQGAVQKRPDSIVIPTETLDRMRSTKNAQKAARKMLQECNSKLSSTLTSLKHLKNTQREKDIPATFQGLALLTDDLMKTIDVASKNGLDIDVIEPNMTKLRRIKSFLEKLTTLHENSRPISEFAETIDAVYVVIRDVVEALYSEAEKYHAKLTRTRSMHAT